jgi:tRNA(fMet)-specific endonuclease VapC
VIEYLLDTNIVIHTMRERPAEIRRHFTRYYGLMAISTATVMELYYGSENSRDPQGNRSQIEGFVARLELLPYDAVAAFHTGLIRNELKTIGRPIGAYDAMIAGHARSRGLVLVTRNTSEFDRVPGLRVESWE